MKMPKMPRLIYLAQDELNDYVHNKAILGDLLVTQDNSLDRTYIYYCNTEDKIGKDANPCWTMVIPKKTNNITGVKMQYNIEFNKYDSRDYKDIIDELNHKITKLIVELGHEIVDGVGGITPYN